MPLNNAISRVSAFKSKSVLYLIVILFILSRLWVLNRGIFMWNDEELYNGTIAMELLRGLNMPLLDYAYNPHNGGTILVGILASVSFTLLGNSYFSLKLVALLFSTLSLIFCLLLLNRHFNKKAAILAGLFFIFSPSTYTESNLIAWGIHGDSIFLSLLTILIFYEIFFSGKGHYLLKTKKSYFLFAAFGLACGFSSYFAYITIYCLISCLFFWFLVDKKFFLKKPFLFFSFSFLAGFSPWIYYNFINSFSGFNIVKLYWGRPEKTMPVFDKMLKYFLFDLPALFDFHRIKILGFSVFSDFYYVVLLFSFFFILIKERNSLIKLIMAVIPSKKYQLTPEDFSKEFFFLIPPVIFSAIFFLSNVSIFYTLEERYLAYRYFIPLYPFMFIILSLFFSKIIGEINKLKGILAITVLVVMLFLGLLGNINIPFYDRTLTYRDLDGFSYERLGWNTVKKFDSDFPKYIELGRKVDPIYRHLYYHGVGWSIGGKGLVWKEGFEKFIKFEEVIKTVEDKYRAYYYQGTGYVLGFNSIYNQYKRCIKVINWINDENKRTFAYLGMSMIIKENFTGETDVPQIVSAVDGRYRKFFYPLLGEYLLRTRGDLQLIEPALDNIKEEDRVFVYQGVGSALLKKCYYNIEEFKWLVQDDVPVQYRNACYEGAGMATGFYFRNKIDKMGKQINKFSPDTRLSVCRGVGRYVAERYGFYFPRIARDFDLLDKQYRSYLYQGVGFQIAWRYGDNGEVSNSILQKLNPACKAFVEKGFKECRATL